MVTDRPGFAPIAIVRDLQSRSIEKPVPSLYLDSLDRLLLVGTGQLSGSFAERELRFVERRQLPGGGFGGRRGGEDLYYTDFGARLLALLSPDSAGFAKLGGYLARMEGDPKDVVDCFGMLNIARTLGQHGVSVAINKDAMLPRLRAQQLPGGAFARRGGRQISAYTTFLAALCFEMLDVSFPDPDGAVASIRALKRPDGGYSELPGHPIGQTSAAAAAVASLRIQNALTAEDAESSTRFLVSVQAPDGGLLAQPSAPESDLLSTFTGCLTLFGLEALGRADTAAVARFVGQVADPEGGFRGSLTDDEPDVEYTYYGLATLALMRAYANRSSRT